MILSWQILDVRAKSPSGAYIVSLVHDPEGDYYVARYCVSSISVNGSNPVRACAIGRSSMLDEVKEMCDADFAINHDKMRVY